MNIRTFVAKSCTFVAKSAIWFSENEGGGQRPFGTFPKIHPFWWRHLSLIRQCDQQLYKVYFCEVYTAYKPSKALAKPLRVYCNKYAFEKGWLASVTRWSIGLTRPGFPQDFKSTPLWIFDHFGRAGQPVLTERGHFCQHICHVLCKYTFPNFVLSGAQSIKKPVVPPRLSEE